MLGGTSGGKKKDASNNNGSVIRCEHGHYRMEENARVSTGEAGAGEGVPGKQ